MDLSRPAFLQGVFSYSGSGLAEAQKISDARYSVPQDKRAQLIYFRAGNSGTELINLSLFNGKKLLRHFPVGAKASLHVPLAVVGDLDPESDIEVHVAAPQGVSGEIVLDIGFVEI